MRARTWLATMAVCVCWAAAMSTSGAQGARDLGALTGVVQDRAGAPLPGASVSLAGPERRSATADARGAFEFLSLRPGRYTVTATLAGFTQAVQQVEVRRGPATTVTFVMAAAVLQETITVGSEAPGRGGRGVQKAEGDATFRVPPPASPAIVAAGLAVGLGRGPQDRGDSYDHVEDNTFHHAAVEPLSTFSVDVDTASYANVRRFLQDGQLPPPGAVRVEELINYFRYDYPAPSGETPFSVTTELAACPWNPRHRLALIGLRGRAVEAARTPPRNLVFLIDVSGSMTSSDKLPLVQQALRMLALELTAADRVALVVYAGRSGLVLPATPGDRRHDIDAAIARLEAGGSTNGAAGIELAYQVAREGFVHGGVNRVILATDGDFNVGVTSRDALVRLIETQRASGVFLSVLGVGRGNLQDGTMEMLADKGNGNYHYLDSLHEARKVLIEEAGGTLVTIAKDVKLQVEFNPATVAGYRLIGYENRRLEHQDFNDDRKDAGEIGAGHTVTALYEIVPAGVEVPAAAIDPLTYQRPAAAGDASDLLTVKLRYKAPDGDTSRLIAATLSASPRDVSPAMGFASAVAEAGLVLRGAPELAQASLASAAERARRFRGDDPGGYRAEFVRLLELAAGLTRLSQR